MANNKRYTFFWKSRSPFSQWYKASFTVDGITYNCAEQYMMHQKAVLFKDHDIAQEVLATDDPRTQKSCGRRVENFVANVWNAQCRDIVKKGNKAKFLQNPGLLEILLNTSGTTLVEASPNDKIWGIGLTAEDPRANDERKWRGTNWLGFALTEVREEIKAEKP